MLVFLYLFTIFYTDATPSVQDLEQQFASATPTKWAEVVPGVKTRLATNEKIIALTLDACGSANDGCDYRIINFLLEQHIPATIFVTGRWIQQHPQDFTFLCKFPKLFAIENHGLNHRPCSINGASAYNIQGTRTIAELVEEVKGGGKLIKKYTGKKPRYYRSGTAHYDDVAARIVATLGYQLIGFNILGDAGATFTQQQARDSIAAAPAGAIIIAHMNHPDKPAGAGVVEGIKALQQANYRFVKIADYDDILV